MAASIAYQTHAFRSIGTSSAPLASFARFVVCGGGVGLASSWLLVLLADRMPPALAAAGVTVVSTLLATELHGRFSFRSEHTGRRRHLQSALTVAAASLVTTGALLCLHALRPDPGAIWVQSVYLGASAAAGVGRFLVLRAVVFSTGSHRFSTGSHRARSLPGGAWSPPAERRGAAAVRASEI
ncbi:hypothetical protein [Streptomyces sp. H27-D2]|uniref:hypothetical protein n=1 Tax=Streptomyces sp. H27-D2 TaxID=3046304 RepID=UPI002DBB59C1|nr:hypothetical protein [Streptomyces sp. H27-D2]MEC4016913.1 hypothetical protein [Streptomyces sp. H27-D2]